MATDESESIRTLVAGFESYDFGGDTEFRAGLPAIIRSLKGKGSSAADIDDTIAKAQWFYYTRKNASSVPFDTYLRYRTGETESIPMRRPSIAPILAGAGTAAGENAAGENAGAYVAAVREEAREESQQGITVTSPEVSTHQLPDAPAYEHDDVPRSVGDRVAAAEIGAGSTSGIGEGRVEVVQDAVVETVAPGPEQSIPFDDVVKLIAEGRAGEIPSVHVPEGLNTTPASESVLSARPKPWEQGGVR